MPRKTRKTETETEVLETVEISPNREIRFLRVPAENGDLLRIGTYLYDGREMSGASFPLRKLDDTIIALQRIQKGLK
jgi:hypothetical protein